MTLTSPPAATPPAAMTPAQRWTLVATVLGSAMAFLDGTVVNVALPALQRDFHAGVAGVGWVVNGYALMLAALILTGGALGDLYGRRRVFGAGVLVFAVASLLCGLARSLPLLVAARLLQGIGGALLIPGSLAMIGAVFPAKSRGRAVGLWSSATSVVTVIGPVLGGVMVDTLSWRLVFLINLPLAAAVLWCLRNVPESSAAPGSSAYREGMPRPSLDLPGLLLVTAGLGGLSAGLLGAGGGGSGGASWPLTLAGAALIAAFIWWESRAPAPMMPLALFHSWAFAGTNLLTFLLYGALGAALFFLPLNLINVQGYTAAQAGASLLPLSLLLAGLSGVFGGLADRHGPRFFLTLGPVLAGMGFWLLGRMGVGGSYVVSLLPAVLVLSLGMALTVAPLTSTVLSSVGEGRSGTASGVNNAVSRAAGLLAVALFTLLMVGRFGTSLQTGLSRSDLPAAAQSQMVAQRSRLAQVQPPAGLSTPQAQQARRAVRLAFADGFRWVCLLSGLMAALAGVVGFFSLGRMGPAQGGSAPGGSVPGSSAPGGLSAPRSDGQVNTPSGQ
ncbi:MFS transporter [Deinococcus sp.]|uniref:MFS transporter n=1 Tax=Deinococcus sp. TaxID=47478 RepID=UPI003C7B7D80